MIGAMAGVDTGLVVLAEERAGAHKQAITAPAMVAMDAAGVPASVRATPM
jgi:hypothetical protein